MTKLLKLAVLMLLAPLVVWAVYIIDSKGVFTRMNDFLKDTRVTTKTISGVFYRGHI